MKIKELLDQAIAVGASDVLLSPGALPALRVEGQLRYEGSAPLSADGPRQLLQVLMSPEQQTRFMSSKSADFAYEHQGRRFRASAFFSNGHPGLAFRLLPASIPTVESLGLPPILSQFMHRPEGLIVFTGATGQGKTTTQASLIDQINRTESRFIVTLEDPIEYLHVANKSIIGQREIGRDIEDFNGALRHIVRQRPDVVMLGEMRDEESTRSTMTLAETGHLVLSTLHTGDAVQAVARLVEGHSTAQQQMVRGQLANVLLAIVNQRLIRGVTGRLVMAAEVLVNTPAAAHLIREGHTEQLYGLMESDQHAGSQSMNHALEILMKQGRISQAEAQRYAINRESRPMMSRERVGK